VFLRRTTQATNVELIHPLGNARDSIDRKKMGKQSKSKKAVETATEESKPENPMNPEMPEEIRLLKEKKERETGKKYKYRAPKSDIPSIPHMLAYGAPEDENRPRSWLELIGYPLALILLFVVTLHIFWLVNPIDNSRYPRGRFQLPKKSKPQAGDAGTSSIPEMSSSTPVKSSEL
jgi:hypothetical protein